MCNWSQQLWVPVCSDHICSLGSSYCVTEENGRWRIHWRWPAGTFWLLWWAQVHASTDNFAYTMTSPAHCRLFFSYQGRLLCFWSVHVQPLCRPRAHSSVWSLTEHVLSVFLALAKTFWNETSPSTTVLCSWLFDHQEGKTNTHTTTKRKRENLCPSFLHVFPVGPSFCYIFKHSLDYK